MAEINFTELQNRTLLNVGGSEAESFLHNIFTCNVEDIADGEAGFGGLLSPQGKILFDFLVIRKSDVFLLDVDEALEHELLKRLTFYRLRADVMLNTNDDGTRIFAFWGEGAPDISAGNIVKDPRLPALGWRVYSQATPESGVEKTIADFHAHRIALGMPQGGEDFAYGAAFPHEALYDQTNGVDFAKGCYVGQEVISRVHHRATVRKRIIQVSSKTALPPAGTPITAGGKPLGEMGSVAGITGLAMLRLDRVVNALAAGDNIMAADFSIEAHIQPWADFNWPDK